MIYRDQFKVEDTLPFLDDVICEWFNNKYNDLSEPQRKALPLIHDKKNVLVSSPTGTGKTLTGFLSIINELFIKAKNNELEDKIYCVYISPLKALANDINKNLNEPLKEIYEIAKNQGLKIPEIRVGVRSGDTDQSERNKMLKKPPHILITTPESLSLALTANKFREKFYGVEYVIVDEIHEVSATKRGSLLSLNLERLDNIAGNFVRIGLSATQAPLDLIATYLCGYDGDKKRDFEIIEVNTNKYLDLKIITPVKDLTMVSYEVANEKMYDILVDLVNSHKTTLIFTNTRSSTEHVAMRLKAMGIENIEAHHSSLGKQTRIEVENKLKNGELKCVITSTSLELGIDIGFIDMVIQIGSPKSVSRALQRIGRSGHGVRDLSMGRFIVFDLDDLMECAVMTRAAYEHEIDKVSVPVNPLDVLSQGIIGMSLEKNWNFEEAYNLIKNSYSFHTLDYNDYISTLKYLSGQIEGNTLFSKIWYDENEELFGKKRSTRMIYFMNVGTIPEEANYNVANERGRLIGQLSDKFVERLKRGDIFVLGAKTYMFLRVSRNNITVKEATGMKPTVPSWTGELLPRSYDLGVLIGKFREELYSKIKNGGDPEDWLIKNYRVDQAGARSLISYIKSQGKFDIPTENHLFIEGYVDKDLYDIIFHIPLGRRVNDALSRAYGLVISNKYNVNTRISVNDNGFMITLNRKIVIKEILKLLNSKNFEDVLKRSIINTELFKQRFRYCATRSLMVLRKYKSTDISVARQQLRSDKLLRVLESINNFPVIKEAFNEIRNDVMDVDNAKLYIENVIEKREYSVRDYSDESSPFSYNLILSGVSDIVLMEDRSKLLKELQNKLLDRIYGTEGIDFLIKDSKLVENYFKNKIPDIKDKNTYIKFSGHFLYIDPFKVKYNSPLSHTSMDLNEITHDLIKEDQIIYAFIRSDQWVNKNYYGIVYNLFKKDIELSDADKNIYNNIENKTFNELKKLNYNEEEIRDSIIHLESSYMIRKKIKNNLTYYIKNEIKPEPGNNSLYKAVELILSSYGPLTYDELLIKLPVNSDLLETALKNMIDNDALIYDYITPIFIKQYMLKSDFDNIINNVDENIAEKRIINFSMPVETVDDYFNKYGFAFDLYDIKIRVGNFDINKINKMVKNNELFYLKAIKNKYAYISKWLLNLLYYLRDEKNSANEDKILDYIKNGYDTDDKLLKISGYDTSVLKAILKELLFKIKIIPENDAYKIYIPDENQNNNKIIEKYGPVTMYELSRFFWFNPAKIDYTKLKPYYYKNEIYYGDNKTDSTVNSIIVKTNDPVSIYLGKYIRNDSYNSRFICNGKEEAMFHVEEKSSSAWIENIDFEDSKIHEFLSSLNDMADKINITSIIINTENQELIDEAKKMDYKTSKNVIYKGNIDILNINNSDLLGIAVKRFSGNKITLNYNSLNKICLGLRNDIEASYSGVKNIELNNYYNSLLLYNFNGPFNVTAYGTKNVISIYKAIKKRDLDNNEETILKYLISENSTENELIKNMRIKSFIIKASIKNLYKINAIAKDKNRKYVTVNNEYGREEAIEALLNYIINAIGFFDDSIYEKLTDVYADDIYRNIINKMIENNIISKKIIPEERKIIYISNDIDINKIKNIKITRIIEPKDIIALFFSDYIKSNFKSLNTYLLFINNSVKLSINVKKSGKYLTVKSITGDNKYKDTAKKEFNDLGYILSY